MCAKTWKKRICPQKLTSGIKCLTYLILAKELRLLNSNFILHSKNIIAKNYVLEKKNPTLHYFPGTKFYYIPTYPKNIYTKHYFVHCANT